jgi:hypothetical protein
MINFLNKEHGWDSRKLEWRRDIIFDIISHWRPWSWWHNNSSS